ncbi:MAG TPA: 2-succinyl-5-enolpyruvyl-6-hydroxy-3-cyclohexene-1-carboxylic-acid synthase [Acidimicrobiales bacterium]|nr:2-succinyl-5-enolpyruvyl-6-hydroxy-3-cyclohexene-1-carboxylic-acid synthase [Acidimicrobiales bacterium]
MAKLVGSVQATFCAALVDEWWRCGVRHAVICPGSRSTPMALALAADGRLRLQVRLDERSAAFVALGIGLESGRPAVLCTTSGTAAAEVHAAVVEAHQARVPLIVVTADRPPELHGVGAPQTIDQRGLFAGALRYECDPGVPTIELVRTWRSLGARLAAEAVAGPSGPGPVHLNLPLRDPLDGEPGALPAGRPNGRPWHEVHPGRHVLEPAGAGRLAELVRAARRPLLIAGARSGRPGHLSRAAASLGWPLLADPRSGARSLGGNGDPVVVAAADAILRHRPSAERLCPDLVVVLGEASASKVVGGWLDGAAGAGATTVLVDPFGEWRDPGRKADLVLRAGPDEVLDALCACAPNGAPAGWLDAWRRAEAVAQSALGAAFEELRASGELTEPAIARGVARHPGVGTVVVASSMPIRDLEWFSEPRAGYPAVVANRGANGIDGVVSTACGVAASVAGAGREAAVVGLVGDLAFLHDLSALVELGAPAARPLGLVVVDNGGGGIFSYLPQATSVDRDRFELLFGTPPASSVADLAGGAGWEVTEARDAEGLERGLDHLAGQLAGDRAAALVCHTDRQRSVEVHEALHAAVAAALDGELRAP